MATRIDCTIIGHEQEWVEYRALRLKDRLRFQRSNGEDEVWVSVRDCLVAWKLTDSDGNEVPQPSAAVELDDLGELDDPMYAWLVASFFMATLAGRKQAQAPPSSGQSD